MPCEDSPIHQAGSHRRLGYAIRRSPTFSGLAPRRLTVERAEYDSVVGLPKHDKIRRVPMTMRLATALQDHRHLRGPNVLYRDEDAPAHLAMRGAPAKAVQELAGHSDLQTMQRYMHLSPAALERSIQLLESRGSLCLEDTNTAGFGDIVETPDR